MNTTQEAVIIDITKPGLVKTIEWFDDRFYKVHFPDGSFDYYPSVTTILEVVNKPFLSHWRGEVGNDIADQKMNDAARKGSAIHHAASVLARGGRVDWINSEFTEDQEREKLLATMKYFHGEKFFVMRCAQEVWLQVVRFVQWWDAVQPKLLLNEQNLFSTDLKLAGTLDFLVEVKSGDYMINGSKKITLTDGIYICDLKTGKQIDDNYYMQISAYTALLPLEYQQKITGGMIIHTNAATRSGIEGVATHLRSANQLAEDFKAFQSVHSLWRRKNEVEKPRIIELPTSLTLTKLPEPQSNGKEN